MGKKILENTKLQGTDKKNWRRIEKEGNKKMRQQKKQAWREGGRLDGWGVKQVKKQKRGEKGLEGNGVKGG